MRDLTLGDLVAEVARRAIDPDAAVIVVCGEPVASGGDSYEIRLGKGGVTVEFTAECDGD